MKQYNISIKEREFIADDIYILHCTRPEDFIFTAGQYVSIEVDEKKREYSLLSAENDEQLSFLIKQIDGGVVSATLRQIPLPVEIVINEPQGYFVDRLGKNRKVFVGTGTGIAPFISMLRSGVQPYLLLQGERTPDRFYFQKELDSLVLKYKRCMSGKADGVESSEAYYLGYVTAYIYKELPREIYDFYLCGSWDMIQAVTHIVDEFFPDSNIYSEGFL